MINIFISYSSKDSNFVERLSNDLIELGFDVWLDKWKIKVGDDIFEKIQYGIRNSDYVILVLSSNSIKSGWVDKEWKIVYWNEITTRQVKLLPILLEYCEIPEYLKFKKYANFTKGYEEAFKELTESIKPITQPLPKRKEIKKPISDISKLNFFKEVYRFAYSGGGLDMSKQGSKDFALNWIETKSEKDFNLFKEVYNYAYSGSGLDMSKQGAKKFAFDWLEQHA